MSIITIILFLLYGWGLGFTITNFIKNSDDFWERNIMRLGIGIGVIPLLGVLLNLLRIPLDWRIFLILSIAFPLYWRFKNIKKLKLPSFKFKLTKSGIYLLVVLFLFMFTFYMYHKGAFVYPWLENGDSYDVAVMAKYIATYKTFTRPAGTEDLRISHYAEPYTLTYNILMGILHQTSPSIRWTLKFFNALLVSLSIPFFYFFVKKFTNNKKIALFSSFVLFTIPSFESHFIFAQQLAALLFFPAFYALESIKDDKKWAFVAAVIIASILITQFSSAATFVLLFLPSYFVVKCITEKNFQKYIILAAVLGLLLSFVYWAPMIAKYGVDRVNPISESEKKFYKTGTSYISTIGDFIWAKDFWPNAGSGNKIDQPIGIGIIISLLVVVSLVLIFKDFKSLFKKENAYISITVLWVFFNFFSTYGNPFLTVNPHRGWSFLAIAIAILVGKGLCDIADSGRKKGIPSILIITPIIILILLTSFYSKYAVNTAIWPQHYANPVTEISAYLWLTSLPVNTRVTSLCKSDSGVIAFDKFSASDWDREILDFKSNFINMPAPDIHSFLKNKDYEYVISDYSCVENFGINETISKLNEMVSSGLFQPVYQAEYQGQKLLTIVFKV